MSQSLRAVKRFRIRELTLASPSTSPTTTTATTTSTTKNSRISPAATAASNLHPQKGSSPPSRSGTGTLNPFVPHKNLESGRWAPPRYSLRRQADLVKHARASGTLHLLPPGPKMSLAQLQASSCPSSVLGKGHVDVDVDVDVEKKKNTVEAAAGLVRSGLVSLRRRREEEEEEEVQEQEQEQAVRPGQEVEEVEAVRAVEKEGEAPHVQGEEVLAREQNSLDAQVDWTQPVEWIGTVRERSVAGADVGNRLYAGKKRMFKGHKWERMRERRVGRTEMLLRDMDNRIQRFKGYRAKSVPLPLARRRNVLKKTQKLPF